MAQENTNTAAPEDPPSEGSVDKIRDIIFGGHIRDYERRFSQLESRLEKENRRLHERFEKRITELEEFIRAEFEKLSNRVTQEEVERAEAVTTAAKNAEDRAGELNQKMLQLGDHGAEQTKELRDELRNQHSALQASLNSVHTEISEALNRESSQLEEVKVSRDELSGLLTELALRLNREIELPGKV